MSYYTLMTPTESLDWYNKWITPDDQYNFEDFQPKLLEWLNRDDRVLVADFDKELCVNLYMFGYTNDKEMFFGIFHTGEGDTCTEDDILTHMGYKPTSDYISVEIQEPMPHQKRVFTIVTTARI